MLFTVLNRYVAISNNVKRGSKMDIIILGLLMIRNCTIYELKKTIATNFTNISSNSMGSIQAAVKKLLAKEMICVHEHVENNVTKKVYEMTQEGKTYFLSSVSKPMLYKEKSMEMSKFFFMGFVENTKRVALIEGYIKELEKELATLEQIKTLSECQPEFDETYVNTLKEKGTKGIATVDDVREIAFFQSALLNLSIAKVKFEVEWFQEFKGSLNGKGVVGNGNQGCI